ncbi:MAG: DUF87 domain-containing protein [Desulfobacterales bacterium]
MGTILAEFLEEFSEMSTKGKKPKNKMHDMVQMLIKSGRIHDPNIQAELANAHETGDYSTIEDILTNQAPFLTADISRMQFEAHLAQIDAFHPRPTDLEFPGNILVAYILDPIIGAVIGTFRLSISDLIRHLAFLGKTGDGKTNAIIALIMSIKYSLGDNVKILVFEPKREYRKYLHPSFLTLNFRDFIDEMFEPPTDKISIFDYCEKVAQNAATELHFQTGGKDVLGLAVDHVIKKMNHPYPTHEQILIALNHLYKYAKTNPEKNAIGSLTLRFKTQIRQDKQKAPYKVPISELQKRDIIFEYGNETTDRLMFEITKLVGKLHTYKQYENSPYIHILIFEESSRLLSPRTGDFGEPILETLARLARDTNIGLIYITQEPASIANVFKANVSATIALPLKGGEQLEEIGKGFNLTKPQFDYYATQMPALGEGNALVSYSKIGRPFPVKFPKVPDELKRNVSDADIKALKSEFLKPFKIVEPPQPPLRPEPVRLSKDHMTMLNVLVENPYLNSSELYDFCNLPPELGTEIRFYLRRDGYLALHDIQINKGGRTPVFSELTDKSFRLLKAKSNYYGGEGFKHALGKHVIDVRLTKRSWIIELEAPIKGRPGQRYDVLAEKDGTYHAFEVTIHLKNLKENIAAALCDDRINTLFIVTLDKATKNRCIKNSGIKDSRVKFITISEVDKKEKRKEANK